MERYVNFELVDHRYSTSLDGTLRQGSNPRLILTHCTPDGNNLMVTLAHLLLNFTKLNDMVVDVVLPNLFVSN